MNPNKRMRCFQVGFETLTVIFWKLYHIFLDNGMEDLVCVSLYRVQASVWLGFIRCMIGCGTLFLFLFSGILEKRRWCVLCILILLNLLLKK